MARDWIKMRHDLAGDPAVITIAEATGLDEFAVIGRLHAFWSWADQQTTNGNAPRVTLSWLDRYVRANDFARALVEAGWLREENDGLSIPNFDRHISETAKTRALTAIRAKNFRARKCARTVTGRALPREEKRRESISKDIDPLTPIPDLLATDQFRAAWSSWIRHRSEIRKPLRPTQAAKQLAKLAAWGADRAIAALEHSIAGGWQGIFEPDAAPAACRGKQRFERVTLGPED